MEGEHLRARKKVKKKRRRGEETERKRVAGAASGGARGLAVEGAGEDKGERGREEEEEEDEEEEDEEEEAIGACEDRRRANYQLAYTYARTPTYPCPKGLRKAGEKFLRGARARRAARVRERVYILRGGWVSAGSTKET